MIATERGGRLAQRLRAGRFAALEQRSPTGKTLRGTIHHIDLTVKDPQRSRVFYDAVLGFMGYRCVSEHPRGIDYELATPSALVSIGVMKAEGAGASRAHDRFSPGLHHLAWRAEDRVDVDRAYEFLLELGENILDAPRDYPQYGEGYYAVFFTDPDGLKFEYVFAP